jgi:hypothetical protein
MSARIRLPTKPAGMPLARSSLSVVAIGAVVIATAVLACPVTGRLPPGYLGGRTPALVGVWFVLRGAPCLVRQPVLAVSLLHVPLDLGILAAARGR